MECVTVGGFSEEKCEFLPIEALLDLAKGIRVIDARRRLIQLNEAGVAARGTPEQVDKLRSQLLRDSEIPEQQADIDRMISHFGSPPHGAS